MFLDACFFVQLSVLPQVHDSQLLCLPALEVWGTLLDPEVGPCTSGSSNSASAAAAGGSAAPGKVLLERAHSEGDSAGAAITTWFECALAALPATAGLVSGERDSTPCTACKVCVTGSYL
jgi:hypothetical protein